MVGNSDGIGLATTKRLLAAGWEVSGVSRSDSALAHPAYNHRVADVTDDNYPGLIEELAAKGPLDLCIYFVGIGEPLDPLNMSNEAHVIDVNLTGMVRTAAGVVPHMAQRGLGHFMGISSFADELTSDGVASYYASKAGFSRYLQCLAPALRRHGVYVTNIRFGFVDTKMAKSDSKPFMMTVEKAVDHVVHCIKKKPVQHSAPRIIIPLIKLLKVVTRLRGL